MSNAQSDKVKQQPKAEQQVTNNKQKSQKNEKTEEPLVASVPPPVPSKEKKSNSVPVSKAKVESDAEEKSGSDKEPDVPDADDNAEDAEDVDVENEESSMKAAESELDDDQVNPELPVMSERVDTTEEDLELKAEFMKVNREFLMLRVKLNEKAYKKEAPRRIDPDPSVPLPEARTVGDFSYMPTTELDAKTNEPITRVNAQYRLCWGCRQVMSFDQACFIIKCEEYIMPQGMINCRRARICCYLVALRFFDDAIGEMEKRPKKDQRFRLCQMARKREDGYLMLEKEAAEAENKQVLANSSGYKSGIDDEFETFAYANDDSELDAESADDNFVDMSQVARARRAVLRAQKKLARAEKASKAAKRKERRAAKKKEDSKAKVSSSSSSSSSVSSTPVPAAAGTATTAVAAAVAAAVPLTKIPKKIKTGETKKTAAVAPYKAGSSSYNSKDPGPDFKGSPDFVAAAKAAAVCLEASKAKIASTEKVKVVDVPVAVPLVAAAVTAALPVVPVMSTIQAGGSSIGVKRKRLRQEPSTDGDDDDE
jgi:hypothetical protein